MTEDEARSLTIPPFLLDLCIAAIEATRAWSSHYGPLPDLDPAMQRLREALRPLLAWQKAQQAGEQGGQP